MVARPGWEDPTGAGSLENMRRRRSAINVRFYELDPYNHLNHTVYLAYCETARVEALAEWGVSLAKLDQMGYRILVVEMKARFIAPVVADDRVEILTEVVAVRRASHEWRQRMEKEGRTLFTLELRAAMSDSQGRPVRVPDFLREILEA